MSWSDELVNMMRSQGAVNNPSGLQMAVMTSENTLRLGTIDLLPSELLFIDRCISPVASKVAGHCPSDGELTDKTTYLPALQAGDQVVVQRMSDTQYLVLGKVVSS